MKNKLLIACFSFLTTIAYSQSKTNEHPLKFNPKSEQFKSIRPIIDATKNKTVVALGEGTHGTKEFNLIRNQISKELIQKHNFRVIAFETAFGDMSILNQEINSTKNIQSIMKENILSIWQTKEIEELFTWVRKYNAKNQDKIILTGFDINFLNNSTVVLEKDQLIQDKNYANLVREISAKAKKIDEAWSQSNNDKYNVDMKNIIKNGVDGYLLTKKLDSIYSANLNINSKIATYNLQLGFQNFYEASKENYDFSRDFAMSEMIRKIQSEMNQKVIVYAHNGHIALQPTLIEGMGGYLKKQYSDNYYALATFTAQGTYNAMTDNVDTKNNVMKPHKLLAVLDNSWEQKMSENPLKNFFVNFQENYDSSYDKKLKMRFYGYKVVNPAEEKQMITKEIKLSQYFDGLIFINITNAAESF